MLLYLWSRQQVIVAFFTFLFHGLLDMLRITLNPFLFIRGLSCPSCIQASLSLNYLKLTIPGFPHNCLSVSCVDIGFFIKNPWSSIGLKIRPQRAFSAFRALLLSANYSVEWSGCVWKPSANSNGLLTHLNCQQRAIIIGPESLNSNKKGAKLSLLSAEVGHTRLDGQHCPLITYQGVFFKGGETLWWFQKAVYLWWIRKS